MRTEAASMAVNFVAAIMVPVVVCILTPENSACTVYRIIYSGVEIFILTTISILNIRTAQHSDIEPIVKVVHY